jgi:ribosome maturation factor RimP
MAAVQNKELVERIAELGERSAMGTDIEIVEIQVRGAGNARLLRVYIDKAGGVTHADCQLISERLGKLLDEDDPFSESAKGADARRQTPKGKANSSGGAPDTAPVLRDFLQTGSYTLEVSSPGIDRRLSKPRDFERVVGQKIRLAVQPSGETRRSLVEGRLAQFSGGTLEVEIAPGNLVRVPLESVQKANLKFEW